MQEIISFLNQHQQLSLALAVVAVLLIIVEFFRLKQKTSAISPLQTTQMMNHDKAIVIDIRSSELYKKGHIIDALSITEQEITTTPKKLDKYKSKPIIIVCTAGVESQKLATLLLKQGYNAYSLAGGMRAWNSANMPFVKA